MKPMMSNAEMNIVSQYAEGRCLEWGSGGSTIYYPRELLVDSWLSIEHDGNWVKKIAPHLLSNTAIVWVQESEQWYVDSVKHSGLFDFILIDGLHREKCLQVAKNMIVPGGSILLHDAGRVDLYELISKYGGELLIDGEEPLNGRFKHRGLAVFE